MPITIKDVAARAGVSVATVSKILNHHPGISEETTRRVEQVMRELEYAPNSRRPAWHGGPPGTSST